MDVFDFFNGGRKPFEVNNKIRLIELFAGVGSQSMALERLGADFEHYRVVEFDKYAVASYNAIHGTDFPTMDVTKISAEDLGIVDTDTFTYLLTYSFPCTDLSVAGLQQGMSKGSGTRSGLLWEVERLLSECKELPQILVMENVPQVHGEKFRSDFIEWLSFLEKIGYTNHFKDLNAKNYGVPQNRERTIMVSLLGNYKFEFPKEIPLYIWCDNVLEEEVDDKYFLTSEKAEQLISELLENGTIDELEQEPEMPPNIPDDIKPIVSLYNNYNKGDFKLIVRGGRSLVT
jgi:DNA (cytosine-5)-methyltransferase 1